MTQLDKVYLELMRQLGVRWSRGRLPFYPANMTDEQKRLADAHYDAMSKDGVEFMTCQRGR